MSVSCIARLSKIFHLKKEKQSPILWRAAMLRPRLVDRTLWTGSDLYSARDTCKIGYWPRLFSPIRRMPHLVASYENCVFLMIWIFFMYTSEYLFYHELMRVEQPYLTFTVKGDSSSRTTNHIFILFAWQDE